MKAGSLEGLFSEIQEMREQHSKIQRLAAEEGQAHAITLEETHKLRAQILSTEDLIRVALHGNATLEQELAEARAHHAFLQNSVRDLQAKVEQLTEEQAQLKRTIDENRITFKKTMHLLYDESADLTNSLGNSSAIGRELEKCDKEIYLLKAKIDEKLQAAAKRVEAESECSALEDQMIHLLTQHEDLRAERQAEEMKLADLTNITQQTVQRYSNSSKIASLERSINLTEEEYYYLRDLCSTLMLQKEQLQQQEVYLRQDIAKAEFKLDALKKWQPNAADAPVPASKLLRHSPPVSRVESSRTLQAQLPSRTSLAKQVKVGATVNGQPATTSGRTPRVRPTFTRIFLDEDLCRQPDQSQQSGASQDDDDLLAPHW